ncbi:MAG: hypothetical protein PHV85_10015 [Desulfovibrionaceae bacterium]|nr:hypothetical protein [Desulfovibrionaceae bacterium]
MLSENEAKFKYCPLLKTGQDKLRFCQGAMCMMWRWLDLEKTGPTDKGCCGLAGGPVRD